MRACLGRAGAHIGRDRCAARPRSPKTAQKQRGRARGRARGAHPLRVLERFGATGQARRRLAGRMPAGDRPHAPDPRPHGAYRPSRWSAIPTTGGAFRTKADACPSRSGASPQGFPRQALHAPARLRPPRHRRGDVLRGPLPDDIAELVAARLEQIFGERHCDRRTVCLATALISVGLVPICRVRHAVLSADRGAASGRTCRGWPGSRGRRCFHGPDATSSHRLRRRRTFPLPRGNPPVSDAAAAGRVHARQAVPGA